ncbi:hypothetical protein HRH25_01075 [Flavisolibacter sp. BT320]|nr:hypothetical protein [Flavisolibacter longurius]
MKKSLRFSAAASCCIALLFVLQGCLKDTYRETYTIYMPVYKSLTEVRANMKGGPAQPLVNTGKLNIFGNYIFLNEINEGIHIIDNTNPASPKNIAFISIPNNMDLAVKGRYLYADSYSDIVVFDISEPTNVRPVKFLDNVIREKNRYWVNNQTNADSIKVVVDYIARDTTVSGTQYRRWNSCPSCMYASADLNTFFSTSAPKTGVGGSTSRFTIVNDYMYAVSNSELYAISIATGDNPQLTSTKNMGWNIETIYPFKDRLFIGSRTGMFIYSLSNPSSPTQLSQFTHATSCDPVIADDKYAYVTLRTGTTCAGNINQLDILDVSNLSAPSLKKTVMMSNPHGLSKDGDKLFICDGTAGLKLYDVSTPVAPKLVQQVQGLETVDVIAMGGRAIVVAKDGLYQFDYSSGNNISQISKLAIQKNTK